MKKIILMLFFLLFLAPQAIGEVYSRWQFFPIKVYIQDNPKAYLVRKAFDEWEANSKAKFFYVDTEKKIPKIIVKFEESNAYGYESEFGRAIGLTYSFTPRGYYATAKIRIYMTYPGTNVKMSDEDLYTTALHEIGHALGLGHSSNKNDVMYKSINGVRHLSSGDLLQFSMIYR